MEKENLILYAKKASENAYANYSKFKVGCAVLTKNNKIFVGANIENASYPVGICAERVAIASAISNGESIKTVVIYSEKKLPYPCGMCRQFIAEFGNDISIIIANDTTNIETTIASLLPNTFKL